ncbi:NAD-dependent epimerase/dehydratase family protein [Propionibacteriaceae bacterium G1746]
MTDLLAGMPHTEADLDDQLSRPSAAVAEALAGTTGDIVVLGAGGKVGPTLVRMLLRALEGSDRTVFAVSRWSDAAARDLVASWGAVPVAADLADPGVYADLPDAGAVYYLAGNKFGTSGNEHLTWWMNAVVPGFAASRYRGVPTVVYSSGNVYPFVAPHKGGCTEDDAVGPLGAYAQSCLAREQAFVHAAHLWGTPVSIYRLNYAVELRYGVLADIATKIAAGQPVDVTMGAVNVVWQRDSTEWSIRSIAHAATPPFILNGTGPETASTRALAHELAGLMGSEVEIVGDEAPEALLNNASRVHAMFGYPDISLKTATAWVAEWVRGGGRQLGKATKFQSRDGRF